MSGVKIRRDLVMGNKVVNNYYLYDLPTFLEWLPVGMIYGVGFAVAFIMACAYHMGDAEFLSLQTTVNTIGLLMFVLFSGLCTVLNIQIRDAIVKIFEKKGIPCQPAE